MTNNLLNQFFLNTGKEIAVSAPLSPQQIVRVFQGQLLTNIPQEYRAIVAFARDVVGNPPPQPFTVRVNLANPSQPVSNEQQFRQGTLFFVQSEQTAHLTANGKRKK